MWALHNYPDFNDFFAISRNLGFQKIELNHQIDSKMLSQVNLDHYQFSSIHEPCPADISTKELVERDWLVSAVKEDCRNLGVKAVKKSIDLAHQLDVPIVVIHCGTVPVSHNFESKLRMQFNAGEIQSDEYLQVKSQIEQSRKDLVGARMPAVKKSLNQLLEYASQFKVKLGLENRYHYMDIPSIDEMADLLSLADASHLGFIYDVGHAQALDRLGFYRHEEWLMRFSSRMIGCHLHDVLGLIDHYAPGLGEIEFKFISKYLPNDAFRTFEMLPGNTLAQVRDGIQKLVEAGCIQYL